MTRPIAITLAVLALAGMAALTTKPAACYLLAGLDTEETS